MKKHVLIFQILVLILSSCTMQKRRYMKGFHTSRIVEVETKATSEEKEISEDFILVQNNKAINPVNYKAPISNTIEIKEKICDTVYMKNDAKLIVKVKGVYSDKTIYVLCDSDNEAEWDIETSKLKHICYANGSIDSLNNINTTNAPLKPGIEIPDYDLNLKRKLDDASAKADEALNLTFGFHRYVLFPGIKAFMLADEARTILKGHKGYEKAYNRANFVYIFRIVIWGLMATLIIGCAVLLFFI